MSSPDEQWWDLQAAEYVLGTLSAEDRTVFAQLLRTDPDVQSRVLEWEHRLDPLHRSTAPVHPAPEVYEKIMGRIGLVSDSTDSTDSNVVPIEKLQRHARFWKLATAATMAVAAAIIGLLVFSPVQFGLRDTPAPFSETQFNTVSILENENGEPIWAISLRQAKPSSAEQNDSVQGSDELIVSVVGQLPLRDDQSHQLWMVLADGSGVQSVGLMPTNPGESKVFPLPIDLSDANQFAVSLEAFGGVPGPDHGPVVAINPIVPPSDSI